MVQIVLVDAPDYVTVIVMGVVLVDALATVMVVQAVDLGAQAVVQAVMVVQVVALGVQLLVLEAVKVPVQAVMVVQVVDLDVL